MWSLAKEYVSLMWQKCHVRGGGIKKVTKNAEDRAVKIAAVNAAIDLRLRARLFYGACDWWWSTVWVVKYNFSKEL